MRKTITDDIVAVAAAAQRVIKDRPYEELEPALRTGIVYYVTRGYEVGGFLTAVLENNLSAAVATADERSLAQLKHLMLFLWNEMPANCFGSKEKVKAWVRKGGLRGYGHNDEMIRVLEAKFGDAVVSEVYDDHA
jgi:hypothetical protein